MGVSGLATFVRENELGEAVAKKFPPKGTKLTTAKSKIIIDGWALLYHLYSNSKLDYASGGQYTQFEQDLNEYFTDLLKAGFSPFVVFDGVTPDIKLKTCITRQESTNRTIRRMMQSLDGTPSKRFAGDIILPVLTGQVATYLLRKLQVPYSVCDGEADVVMGSHAINNDCAVFSKDSDFFVFSSNAGYVPLDSVRVTPEKLSCRIYKREGLAKFLGIAPELLPVFATLCGNDFVNKNLLKPFRFGLREMFPATELANFNERGHDVARVGKFLARFKTQEEAFEAAAELYNTNLEKLLQERAALQAAKEAEAKEKALREAEAQAAQEAEAKAALEGTEGEQPKAEEKVPEAKPAEEPKKEEAKPETEEKDVEEKEADGADDATKEEEAQEQAFEVMDPAVRKERFLELLKNSAQQYVAQKVLLGAESSLKIHPTLVPRYNNSDVIPGPIVQLYRQDLFGSNLMAVLTHLRAWHQTFVDDTAQASSVNLALPIRKIIYGILLGGGGAPVLKDESGAEINPVVVEYIREGIKTVEQKVEPAYLFSGKKLPNLQTIVGLAPRVRASLFLDILQANTPTVFALPQEWIFGVAVLRSFIQLKHEAGKALFDTEVAALLACMIAKSQYATAGRHDTPLLRSRSLLHFLSEWQDSILTGMLLNNVALNPLPQPSVAQLYDGESLVYYLNKSEGKDVNNVKKQLFKAASDIELFDKLYAAVVEGVGAKLKKDDAKRQEFKSQEAVKEAIVAEQRAATVKNQFGALEAPKKPHAKQQKKENKSVTVEVKKGKK